MWLVRRHGHGVAIERGLCWGQVRGLHARARVPDFPDPRVGPPPSTLAGDSLILGRGGYILAIPSSIAPSSPGFKHAATACNFGRPPPR